MYNRILKRKIKIKYSKRLQSYIVYTIFGPSVQYSGWPSESAMLSDYRERFMR